MAVKRPLYFPKKMAKEKRTGTSTTNGTPAPKKARTAAAGAGGSDRVTLNVGGQEFATAAETLRVNSTYFEATLCNLWNQDDDADGSPKSIFLDQDPAAFSKILAYMRRGVIKVDDVDMDVLALAEFLGVDRLLRAVKARSYRNLRPAFTGNDDEAERAFDSEHGGIMSALTAGILPGAFTRTPVEKKDLAILKFRPEEMAHEMDLVRISISDTAGTGVAPTDEVHLVGALNWLHWQGYTKHEPQMNTGSRYGDTQTFSRIRRNPNDVLVPSNDESFDPCERNWKKEFSLILLHPENMPCIHAPGEFSTNEGETRKEGIAILHRFDLGPDDDYGDIWLQKNKFLQRENDLERAFEYYFKQVFKEKFPDVEPIPDVADDYFGFRLYSRNVEYFPRND